MNLETLHRANDLVAQIERLETQKLGWSRAERFQNQCVTMRTNTNQTVNLYAEHIDLDVLRSITIASIDKQLKPLKDELETL